MGLTLNGTREAYREFYGRNTEQMSRLIADGRVPMNTAQLMKRRLEVRNSDADVKSSYMDKYFDTGDAVVYHPDGRAKIVLDSQHLRDLTPDTSLNNGALVLTEEVYNSLEGEEFKKGKLGKTGEWLSREEVKAHRVWRVLARDQILLNDYADFIFVEGKERFGYDIAMGVYPRYTSGDSPEMREWYVDRLQDRSNADGWSVLDLHLGLLIGITPDSPSGSIN